MNGAVAGDVERGESLRRREREVLPSVNESQVLLRQRSPERDERNKVLDGEIGRNGQRDG